MIIKVMNT